MTAKIVRSFMVSGCLVAMLALPAEVVVAPSPIKPKSDQSVLTFWDPPSVLGGVVKTSPSTDAWSRNTFVLIRADVTHPQTLTDGTLSTERPAKVQPASPGVAVPGTVQNLRRADRP